MMIRRILPVLIGILMMSYCPLPIFAAEPASDAVQNAKGQIHVVLPTEEKEMSVHFARIAACTEMGSLQNDTITELLGRPVVDDKNVIAEDGRASITGLLDGIYRLDIVGPKEYEFAPALVSIPMWSEEEQKMLYEVEVIPKYVYHEPLPDEEEIPPDVPEKIQSPKTGDESKAAVYASFGLISLIILVIMSCHNRLRCGKMRVK